MKIILATPLYPPDIEPVALYCKELAKRLSKKDNSVTVVTYGNLLEQIAGVVMVSTDKCKPLLVRIILYTLKLWYAIRDADILYVQDGTSVELPVLLATIITKTPFVLFLTDTNAIKQTRSNNLRRLINQTIIRRARATITEIPPERPEILPFSPLPERELLEYERSWTRHLQILSDINI